MYFHRDLEQELAEALTQFPAALVTGPRQAGKSTLLLKWLPGYEYVTLDDHDTRELALRDPELFLSLHTAPLVIDEIQYAPNLLSHLKMRIDADRHRYGQYVLTGSQTFQLMQGVTETLAGRIAIFQLYPLSWSEIGHIAGHEESFLQEKKMAEQVVTGFYPEFLYTPPPRASRWFASYLTTYLERDVRNVKAVQDLASFQTFLSLLATRAGQLVNLTEIGKECGVTTPTAKSWLTILEATYVIYLLRPYYRNRTKRLVKSPKLYFVDTGLLCHLLGIDTGERFFRSAERGHIFENMVVMEAVKQAAISPTRRELFFYRTHGGHKVDLLIEERGELEAYEIKLAKSINPSMGASLIRFHEQHPDSTCRLLCLREEPLPLTQDISATHWRSIVQST